MGEGNRSTDPFGLLRDKTAVRFVIDCEDLNDPQEVETRNAGTDDR
jgi:hypothetical protein